MASTILICGFARFGRLVRNPSGEIAARLAGRMIRGAMIESVLLPVARETAWPTLVDALDHHRPRVVLAIGVARRRRVLAIEKRSRNRDAFTRADELGHRARGEPVLAGSLDVLETRLPADAIAAAVRAANLEARVSHDAGSFLCNHVYHRLLDASAARGFDAVFVHLPPLPEDAPADSPGLSLADGERGVRAVLEWLAGNAAGRVSA